MMYQLLLLFSLLMVHAEARELEFVQAIWRHGDRAPKKLPYPSDSNDEKYWPRGWGELTDLGIQQLEELGNFFRYRYVGKFVNPNFDPSEISIKASNANRAVTSAQAMLNGMYNLNVAIVTQNQQLFPIAIQSPSNKSDNFLLKSDGDDCDGYKKGYKSIKKNFDKNLNNEYSDLYQFLGEATGYGKKITTKKVGKLVDVQREMIHNLPQPSWVTQQWPQYSGNSTIQIISEIDRRNRMNELANESLQKFRGGFLLGDWLLRAKAVTTESQGNPSKMMLFSSHEGTVLPLLFSLEIPDYDEIPYAATIIMEIYRNDDGTFDAEIYYRKNGILIPKVVPGCAQACPVNQLLQTLEKNAYFSFAQVSKACKSKGAKLSDVKDEEDDD